MKYQIIAESVVHPGRQLLRGPHGDCYIRLASGVEPIAMASHDFDRLRAMHQYRPIVVDFGPDPLDVMAAQEQIAS